MDLLHLRDGIRPGAKTHNSLCPFVASLCLLSEFRLLYYLATPALTATGVQVLFPVKPFILQKVFCRRPQTRIEFHNPADEFSI